MQIKSLENTPPDALFAAFKEAFADYEVQLDKEAFFAMLKRRGFSAQLSFGVFDNEEIVSFLCNGISDYYGLPTAYDTASGTLKSHRNRGLTTLLFEHSFPRLQKAGIKQYLLEVLTHNAQAFSVYEKLGFDITREFNYFIADNQKIKKSTKSIYPVYTLKAIDIKAYPDLHLFGDMTPSWQNMLKSINRSIESFMCLGVFKEEHPVGYGVFDPASGDVAQIAVDKDHRRRGIGALLLREMVEANKHSSLKIVNVETCCTIITKFLESNNIQPTGRQFEMVKPL